MFHSRFAYFLASLPYLSTTRLLISRTASFYQVLHALSSLHFTRFPHTSRASLFFLATYLKCFPLPLFHSLIFPSYLAFPSYSLLTRALLLLLSFLSRASLTSFDSFFRASLTYLLGLSLPTFYSLYSRFASLSSLLLTRATLLLLTSIYSPGFQSLFIPYYLHALRCFSFPPFPLFNLALLSSALRLLTRATLLTFTYLSSLTFFLSNLPLSASLTSTMGFS
jgi:hypothetical protein